MFLFVLALLFFGGLGFMLYLIGETIGGKSFSHAAGKMNLENKKNDLTRSREC